LLLTVVAHSLTKEEIKTKANPTSRADGLDADVLPSIRDEVCHLGLSDNTRAGLDCLTSVDNDRPTCRCYMEPCKLCQQRDVACGNDCGIASARYTGGSCPTSGGRDRCNRKGESAREWTRRIQ